jgi:hypothetical protein
MRPKAAYIIDGYQHSLGVCDEIRMESKSTGTTLTRRQDFFPRALARVNTAFWERCAVQSEIECQILGVGKRFDLGKATFASISSPRCSVCIFDSNSCLQQTNNAKPRRLEVHQSRPCVKVQTLVRGDSRHRRLITNPQILKPAQENLRESLQFPKSTHHRISCH